MTIDEICAAANRGEPVPENLLLHDAELFVCLRDTYSRYHSGQLKREDAEVEKNDCFTSTICTNGSTPG